MAYKEIHPLAAFPAVLKWEFMKSLFQPNWKTAWILLIGVILICIADIFRLLFLFDSAPDTKDEGRR